MATGFWGVLILWNVFLGAKNGTVFAVKGVDTRFLAHSSSGMLFQEQKSWHCLRCHAGGHAFPDKRHLSGNNSPAAFFTCIQTIVRFEEDHGVMS